MDAQQLQHEFEALLEPGEQLIWYGVGDSKRSIGVAMRPLAGAAISILIFIALVTFMFWQSHQQFLANVPPRSRAFFEQHDPLWYLPILFFGGFFGLIGLMVYFLTRKALGVPRYAVTDRRLLTLNGGVLGVVGPVSFTPEQLVFVKVHSYPDGTGDILFSLGKSGGASINLNGLPVNLPAKAPEIGFIGVQDPYRVEQLVRELMERPDALPLTGRLSPEALKVILPADLSRKIDEGDLSSTTKGSWFWGLPFALIGSLFVWIGAQVFLGFTPVTNGGSHTPADPHVGGLIFGLAGLLFASIGFYGLLYRSDLILDTPRRSYRFRKGLLPFAVWRSGGFDEFDRLQVLSEKRSTKSGHKDTVWCIDLIWKMPGHPRFRMAGSNWGGVPALPDLPTARAACERLASRLDVSMEAPQHEPVVASVVSSSPQAQLHAQNQPYVKRFLSANRWLAIPALLLLNSWLGVIVWEDHWIDTAGVVYQRDSTLLRVDQVAFTPDGRRHTARTDYMPWGSSSTSLDLPSSSAAHDYHFGLRLGRPDPEAAISSLPPGSPASLGMKIILLRRQANADGIAKRWHQAAQDYAQIVEIEEHAPNGDAPGGPDSALIDDTNKLILVRLAADDRSGYRQACASLLQRYGARSNPFLANTVAWEFALAPDATQDYTPVLRLIAEAVRTKRDYVFLNTQGLLLCRAGRDEAAIRTIQAGLALVRKGGREDWLALGIAHRHLGHQAEARRYLDRACQEFDSELAHPGSPKPAMSDAWIGHLQDQVLSDEAHALRNALR